MVTSNLLTGKAVKWPISGQIGHLQASYSKKALALKTKLEHNIYPVSLPSDQSKVGLVTWKPCLQTCVVETDLETYKWPIPLTYAAAPEFPYRLGFRVTKFRKYLLLTLPHPNCGTV